MCLSMHDIDWFILHLIKEISMTEKKASSSRRGLLKGAVAAGALAAPMISKADTVSLRFQSTWPAKDIFHEYANDFAKKVNDMASGLT